MEQSSTSSWADPTPPAAPTSSVARRWTPLLAWLLTLGIAITLLAALGRGGLAGPDVLAPSTWTDWFASREPAVAAMALVRLGALALAWYLVGVTSIAVLARALRAARLVRVADMLSVGPVRVLAQQALGVGLAAGVVVAVTPTGGATAVAPIAAAPPTTVAVAPVAAPAADPAPTASKAEAKAAAIAPTVIADDVVPFGSPSPTTPAPGRTPSTPADDADAPVAAAADAATTTQVRVAAGDHFWSISEAAVARHLGRPGTEAEVAAHWQATVEMNVDRLVVGGNPDVLLPGQLVLVPHPAEVLP